MKPPDATDRRPERHHPGRLLILDKVSGKIAKSRWNQPPDWHSDLHLRSTHTVVSGLGGSAIKGQEPERFPDLFASRASHE